MPKFQQEANTIVAYQLPCGNNKTFTNERMSIMWLKLHEKKCTTCKNAETLHSRIDEVFDINSSNSMNILF